MVLQQDNGNSALEPQLAWHVACCSGFSTQRQPTKGHRLQALEENMGTPKIKVEGGQGGHRGHSNMSHWMHTEKMKDVARKLRRKASQGDREIRA
jgi:hypothetical protein